MRIGGLIPQRRPWALLTHAGTTVGVKVHARILHLAYLMLSGLAGATGVMSEHRISWGEFQPLVLRS